ncbi:unnamed protein product [Durusdinium trenchii]|uniref:Uncharacterized protein n=1 Tax=Durusdinium trenchii TaxID=1381693 RepID=A0ABP0SY66_9DINO
MAFAGSIQDRLRGRDEVKRYRGYPVNVSGHVEKLQDYSHSCHHLGEIKEQQRRIEALEEKLRRSDEAKLQMKTEIDLLKDQLQEKEFVQKRNETIIESQKQLAVGYACHRTASIGTGEFPTSRREHFQ